MSKNNSENSNNPCPGHEVFVQAFMQELPPDKLESFIDHLLVCQKCKLKFETLSDLSKELREYEKDVNWTTAELKKEALSRLQGFRGHNTRISFWKIAPIAALLVAVVAAGLYFLVFQAPVTERGAEEAALELIYPPVSVDKAPEKFEWTAVPGTDDYKFTLIDDELNTIFGKSIEEDQTFLILPQDVRESLQKGHTYVWKVTADNNEMVQIAEASSYFTIDY
jgi:hypothetical protein